MKIITTILFLLFPLISSAQASGGQIVRHKPRTTGTAKFAPSSNVSRRNKIIQNLIDNMTFVEGGWFTMGTTKEQIEKGDSIEIPVREIRVSSFYIGRFEVTQEEWQAVMGNNPSDFEGPPRPVENVSWNDCQTFIKKLNSITHHITHKEFRLPTEIEWEYIARGGRKARGLKYSGSNYLVDVGWYKLNSDMETHSVGSKSPNELGIYDMSGNVWEWCDSWSYSNQPIIRGGGWNDAIKNCRVSCRLSMDSDSKSNEVGFRLAYDTFK